MLWWVDRSVYREHNRRLPPDKPAAFVSHLLLSSGGGGPNTPLDTNIDALAETIVQRCPFVHSHDYLKRGAESFLAGRVDRRVRRRALRATVRPQREISPVEPLIRLAKCRRCEIAMGMAPV